MQTVTLHMFANVKNRVYARTINTTQQKYFKCMKIDLGVYHVPCYGKTQSQNGQPVQLYTVF